MVGVKEKKRTNLFAFGDNTPVAYATIGDLISALEELRDIRARGEYVYDAQYEDLRRMVGRVLGRGDVKLFGEIKKVDEYIWDLKALGNPETPIAEEPVVVETEKELGSKAVDPYVLRQLLRDLDEHEAKLDLEAESERLGRRYGVPKQTVKDLIAEKLKIQARLKEELLRENPTMEPEMAEIVADEQSEMEMAVRAELEEAMVAGGQVEEVIRVTEETVAKLVEEPEAEWIQIEKEGLRKLKLTEAQREQIRELIEEVAIETVVAQKTEKTVEGLLNRVGEGELLPGVVISPTLKDDLTEIVETAINNDPTAAEMEMVQMLETQAGKVIPEAVKVEVRVAVAEMRRFGEEHPRIAEEHELIETRKEVIADFVAVNGELDEEQRSLVEEYVDGYVGWCRAIEPIRIKTEEVETTDKETEESEGGGRLTKTQIEQGIPRVETLMRVIRTPQNIYQKLINIRTRLERAGVKVPAVFNKNIRFETFERINKMVMENPAVEKLLYFAQKREALGLAIRTGVRVAAVNTLLKIGAPAMAGKVLGWVGVETIGKWTVEGFVKLSLRAIRRYGVEQGVGLMIKAVATRTAAKMAAGTVGKVALEAVIVALGGATGPPGWVITLILIGLDIAWQAVKFVFKRVKAFFDKISEGLGLDTPWLDSLLRDNFGKFGGSIVKNVGTMAAMAVGLLVAIPTALMAIPSTIIGLIVVLVIVVPLVATQLLTAPQVAMLVPPPMGGGCVRVIDGAAENGEANCPRGLPEQTAEGVDRENYFRLADQWKSGKNHARECFDAVVCKSKAAGILPAWSLWAWLHESDASNYSHGEVEDFGIHTGGVPNNDFNAQLEKFLEMDHGASCGGDYWLGFASMYLNGTCDPDQPHVTSGQTGRQYYEELQQTWAWVTNGAPLPNSIHVSPSGGSCEGDTNLARGGVRITDENGQEWLCADEETAGGMSNSIVAPPWVPMGEIPEGCPNRLPANSGYFTQGPFAPNCSHEHMSSAAIDIGIGGGSEIVATHPGIVKFGESYDAIYGYYVDVLGKCEGKEFFTRYAHMPSFPNIQNGAQVNAGDYIGQVDTTGSSTGNHIHYHINGLDKSYFGQYLGLDEATTAQLWGCCGVEWNGKACP